MREKREPFKHTQQPFGTKSPKKKLASWTIKCANKCIVSKGFRPVRTETKYNMHDALQRRSRRTVGPPYAQHEKIACGYF